MLLEFIQIFLNFKYCDDTDLVLSWFLTERIDDGRVVFVTDARLVKEVVANLTLRVVRHARGLWRWRSRDVTGRVARRRLE